MAFNQQQQLIELVMSVLGGVRQSEAQPEMEDPPARSSLQQQQLIEQVMAVLGGVPRLGPQPEMEAQPEMEDPPARSSLPLAHLQHLTNPAGQLGAEQLLASPVTEQVPAFDLESLFHEQAAPAPEPQPLPTAAPIPSEEAAPASSVELSLLDALRAAEQEGRLNEAVAANNVILTRRDAEGNLIKAHTRETAEEAYQQALQSGRVSIIPSFAQADDSPSAQQRMESQQRFASELQRIGEIENTAEREAAALTLQGAIASELSVMQAGIQDRVSARYHVDEIYQNYMTASQQYGIDHPTTKELQRRYDHARAAADRALEVERRRDPDVVNLSNQAEGIRASLNRMSQEIMQRGAREEAAAGRQVERQVQQEVRAERAAEQQQMLAEQRQMQVSPTARNNWRAWNNDQDVDDDTVNMAIMALPNAQRQVLELPVEATTHLITDETFGTWVSRAIRRDMSEVLSRAGIGDADGMARERIEQIGRFVRGGTSELDRAVQQGNLPREIAELTKEQLNSHEVLLMTPADRTQMRRQLLTQAADASFRVRDTEAFLTNPDRWGRAEELPELLRQVISTAQNRGREPNLAILNRVILDLVTEGKTFRDVTSARVQAATHMADIQDYFHRQGGALYEGLSLGGYDHGHAERILNRQMLMLNREINSRLAADNPAGL